MEPTKEQIIARAQRDADRTGKSLAILNLNTSSPLYVIRDWDERYADHPQLVMKVGPDKNLKRS